MEWLVLGALAFFGFVAYAGDAPVRIFLVTCWTAGLAVLLVQLARLIASCC